MALSKWFLFLGAFFAMTSVILGAFGAHALKQKLSTDMLSVFEVGVRYQMYHALALILIALIVPQIPGLHLSGWLFVLGIVLFSGSLYILALSGNRLWGAVTPIGGIIWVIGWLIACYNSLRI